ncbi:hypothetical protein [Nocardia cyriacigeorgica]|uniref:hypothetical protein n=1 Tax=Nocardia cyriacigeorgica TaxID=135487 RepID=UPI001893624D|nr:hypothetical protein [Nocardia cyriacigeorgica]MBF6417000.1 hypothetical protein [Nocardia cyriacigeorgica]
MTDDTGTGEFLHISSDDLTDTSDWFAAPDETLQMIASHADFVGVGPELTLIMSGTLVSGEVISIVDFYRGAAAAIREATADVPVMGEGADNFARLVFDRPAEFHASRPKNATNTPIEMTRYLHLGNVTIQTPAGIVNTQRLRVLLARVSAWYLGRPLYS